MDTRLINQRDKLLSKLMKKSCSSRKSIQNRASAEKIKLGLSSIDVAYARLARKNYVSSGRFENFLSPEERIEVTQSRGNNGVPAIIHKSSRPLKRPTKKETLLIDYVSNDIWIKGHVDEFHRAYNNGCYTCAFILARKIVENLIINIINKKYPQNPELTYSCERNRFHDLKKILENLFEKQNDFAAGRQAVVKLYELAIEMKNNANNKTHSWFHLVKKAKVIEELDLNSIFDLIKRLNKDVGLQPAI